MEVINPDLEPYGIHMEIIMEIVLLCVIKLTPFWKHIKSQMKIQNKKHIVNNLVLETY